MTPLTPYTVVRTRRRTVQITVELTGEVIVRAPARLSGRAIAAFVAEKADWIARAQAAQQARAAHMHVLTPAETAALRQAAHETLPAAGEAARRKTACASRCASCCCLSRCASTSSCTSFRTSARKTTARRFTPRPRGISPISWSESGNCVTGSDRTRSSDAIKNPGLRRENQQGLRTRAALNIYKYEVVLAQNQLRLVGACLPRIGSFPSARSLPEPHSSVCPSECSQRTSFPSANRLSVHRRAAWSGVQLSIPLDSPLSERS